METRLFSPEAIIAEEDAKSGEASGHRIFQLAPPYREIERPLRFITFGCQGSGSDKQREVAALLNEFAANPETKPDFILILGDNLYEWGANAADDPQFKKYFHDIYQLEHLTGIPFFLIPGNHDENRQNAAMAARIKEKGIPRIMHQVAHSYIKDEYFSAVEKRLIYQQPLLELDKLPAWNMPRRYYSLIANDVQIFCVDSNTYINEYLQLIHKLMTGPEVSDERVWLQEEATSNQAAWLQCEVLAAQIAGRKVILAEHHPLYTAGKRAYERPVHNDLGIYLNKTEINQGKIILNQPDLSEETPFNACITACFRQQKLTFDLVLAAHDHNILYYHSSLDHNRICELIVGSGGGELQDRNKFSEQSEMGCFLKQTGFAMITHSAGEGHLQISVHTTGRDLQKHHLLFDTRSHHAIIAWDDTSGEQTALKEFYQVVESAIQQYFHFLGMKQNEHQGKFFSPLVNTSHGTKGAERAHQLWAYINRHHPARLLQAINHVYTQTKRGLLERNGNDNSLVIILDKAMIKKYGVTMEQFTNQHNQQENDATLRVTK